LVAGSLEATGERLSGELQYRRAARVRAVGPFRRVLAGFDGSPDGADAIRAAAAIVARDGGHVVALSVIRRASRADGDSEQDGEGRNLAQLAETVFGELRRDLPTGNAVRMSAQVVYADRGTPAQVVTRYAAEHGFDVLVLGRHGDGRRRKSRLGQVADRAVQECSVPVLLLSGL
jgi:nucleotide-binding universal stress UspA family protein